jgi:transposase-like protein/lambda repressor-like predicted transcriptional regulator
MKQQNVKIDRNEEMATLYESGMTLEEVGQKFGVTRERVRQILENFDQGLIQFELQRRRKEYVKLIKARLDEGKRVVEIAKELGMKRTSGIYRISPDLTKYIHQKRQEQKVSYLQEINDVIEKEGPKTLRQLAKLMQIREGTLANWLSRNDPGLLRTISRRPSSIDLQTRRAKIHETLEKNPDITFRQLAETLGVNYSALYVWVTNNEPAVLKKLQKATQSSTEVQQQQQ